VIDVQTMPCPGVRVFGGVPDTRRGRFDDRHNVVMVRLRTLQHAGAHRDGSSVLDALAEYVAASPTGGSAGRRLCRPRLTQT